MSMQASKQQASKRQESQDLYLDVPHPYCTMEKVALATETNTTRRGDMMGRPAMARRIMSRHQTRQQQTVWILEKTSILFHYRSCRAKHVCRFASCAELHRLTQNLCCSSYFLVTSCMSSQNTSRTWQNERRVIREQRQEEWLRWSTETVEHPLLSVSNVHQTCDGPDFGFLSAGPAMPA